jgi:hypothetical protein
MVRSNIHFMHLLVSFWLYATVTDPLDVLCWSFKRVLGPYCFRYERCVYQTGHHFEFWLLLELLENENFA